MYQSHGHYTHTPKRIEEMHQKAPIGEEVQEMM